MGIEALVNPVFNPGNILHSIKEWFLNYQTTLNPQSGPDCFWGFNEWIAIWKSQKNQAVMVGINFVGPIINVFFLLHASMIQIFNSLPVWTYGELSSAISKQSCRCAYSLLTLSQHLMILSLPSSLRLMSLRESFLSPANIFSLLLGCWGLFGKAINIRGGKVWCKDLQFWYFHWHFIIIHASLGKAWSVLKKIGLIQYFIAAIFRVVWVIIVVSSHRVCALGRNHGKCICR